MQLDGVIAKRGFGNIKESFRQDLNAFLVIRVEVCFVIGLACGHPGEPQLSVYKEIESAPTLTLTGSRVVSQMLHDPLATRFLDVHHHGPKLGRIWGRMILTRRYQAPLYCVGAVAGSTDSVESLI